MDVIQDINEEFSEVAVEHRNRPHQRGGSNPEGSGASRTIVEEETRSRVSSGSGGELSVRTLGGADSVLPFVPSSSEGSNSASHVVEEAGADLDAATASSSSGGVVPAAAARVLEDEDEEEEEEEEDESEYEYEDDDAFVSGFIEETGIASAGVASSQEEKPVKIEEEMQVQAQAQTSWREPSRQAVDMSLRAEKETTGGKRRLMQDLYRIMNQDTEKAGFDLEPVEDDMGKWRIRVFQFDPDSNLAKDMLVLSVSHIELEMTFPDDYPFQPPFVRVVRPRFKRQTGFVMSGAICMELLTKDGWNPVNDIESVIVSIRSLLVVGDGRLEAAASLPEKKYEAYLAAAKEAASSGAAAAGGQGEEDDDNDPSSKKRIRTNSAGDSAFSSGSSAAVPDKKEGRASDLNAGGSYSVSEAQAAYNHLSDYHKKKGWDTSGWWAKKG
jgi:ubiquitin-protein ligase